CRSAITTANIENSIVQWNSHQLGRERSLLKLPQVHVIGSGRWTIPHTRSSRVPVFAYLLSFFRHLIHPTDSDSFGTLQAEGSRPLGPSYLPLHPPQLRLAEDALGNVPWQYATQN